MNESLNFLGSSNYRTEVGPYHHPRTVILGIPELPSLAQKNLPILFSSPEKERFRSWKKYRFSQAQTVMCEAASGGFGDSIMQLRHLMILAKKAPEKLFKVHIPHTLVGLPFQLPTNMVFSDEYPTIVEDDFFLSLDHKTPLPVAMKKWKGEVTRTVTDNSFCINATDLGVKPIVEILKDDLNRANPVNVYDIFAGSMLAALGVEVTSLDLQSSLFADQNNKTPLEKGGILLIPDAAALEAPETKPRRSCKSFDPSDWFSIFQNIPPSKQLAIVKGVCHPAYTMAVSREARKAGHKKLRFLTFPSLNDLLQESRNWTTIVGMDSGTTHLLAEYAMADKSVIIRELFNTAAFPLQEYGIRGLGKRGKILSYHDDLRIHFDPKIVADFILS